MNYFRKQQTYFFIPFLLLLTSVILTGCVDLSGSRSAYRKKATHNTSTVNKNTPNVNTTPVKKGEVHTMRGGLGIFSKGMNQLRDTVADKYHISSRSTMWYNAGEVSRNIIDRYYRQKEHRPIILIGHSLGANEQIKVARNLNDAGVPVALLVTVDAVSQTIVPPNVKQVLNVYKPGYVPMFSGLKLRAVNPEATHIENVNVDSLKEVNVNHFTIDKDKVVQAMILDKVEKVLIDGNSKGA
ncbi:hypothetical protein [Legionella quateirensis]|uniref:Thioesterase domain-containing protein n=1 Tax=Legionella quateirensis TaxID=45072 RepID=A0A378KVG7_9GAMM|nr:hypothetical protein [Legionella quateirensis]KTD47686.1 hypothetical protein Lqua_2079 [Legionella quateirensis]STY18552.1 Uncharacterised protein [Legionella quateirensis]